MALNIAAKAACVPSQLEDRISKGFRAVEIITFEKQRKHSFRLMQKVLNDYSGGLEFVSIHTPSELTIADAIDEAYRKRGLKCLEKTVRLAARINCKRVVFHAFQNVSKLGTIDDMFLLRERAFQKCVEGIRSLGHLCENFGVRLCLENINACIFFNQVLYVVFSASPLDLLSVVREVGSDFLKLCLDVAHAQNVCNFILKNPELKALFNVDELTLERFCEMVIDHVDLIHLSDAKGIIAGKGSDNLPLGEGEIDFRRVLRFLSVKRFRHPVVLEIDEIDVNNAVNMVRSREFLLRMVAGLGLR